MANYAVAARFDFLNDQIKKDKLMNDTNDDQILSQMSPRTAVVYGWLLSKFSEARSDGILSLDWLIASEDLDRLDIPMREELHRLCDIGAITIVPIRKVLLTSKTKQ